VLRLTKEGVWNRYYLFIWSLFGVTHHDKSSCALHDATLSANCSALALIKHSNCAPRDRATKRAQLVVVCRLCVYYASVDSSGTATTKRNKSGDEFAPRISFEGVIEAVEELSDTKRPVKRAISQVRAAL